MLIAVNNGYKDTMGVAEIAFKMQPIPLAIVTEIN